MLQDKALIRQGLELPRASRNDPTRPYWLAYLAIAQARLGQTADALPVINTALDLVHTTGAFSWQAELLRLKGELLLNADGGWRMAEFTPETCFVTALDIARHQQAKSLELRAAISLSRLWISESKHDQVHDLLAPIYNGFTEGFDTADLKEAKQLLEEFDG